MVDGAVAVHQEHRGGEIEDTGGEDQHLDTAVVRLADWQGRGGQIESLQAEHDHGVEAEGGEPGGEDVEDGEGFAEERQVEVLVGLTDVSLHSYEDETERVLLSEGSPHHCLDLTEVAAEWPALREGGVNSPGGHAEPCQELAQGQGDQQQQGGDRQHLGGGHHIQAEHEHQVGDDDEEADHEEDEALENLHPLDCVVEEVLSVWLEEGVVTGPVLQPHGGRGQQSAEDREILAFQNFSNQYWNCCYKQRNMTCLEYTTTAEVTHGNGGDASLRDNNIIINKLN